MGIILGVLILIVTAVGGCSRAQKDKNDKVYQGAFSEVQDKFSKYIVENYQGVKKIEWQGVDIERNDSPGHDTSLFGNITSSLVKIYVTDTRYIKARCYLSNLATYDKDKKQFVFDNQKNFAFFDELIEVGFTDLKSSLTEKEKKSVEGFVKGPAGSSDAVVKYNVKMSDM